MDGEREKGRGRYITGPSCFSNSEFCGPYSVADQGIFKRGGVLFYNYFRRLWRRKFYIKKIENLPKVGGGGARLVRL